MAARMDVMTSFKDPFDDGMRNYIGTLNVLEFARKIKCPKVLYRSSFTVYSEENDLPIKETGMTGPISPYAMHKLFSETALELYNQHYGMKNASFRFFNLYGPRQDPSSIYSGVAVQFLAKTLKNNSVPVYGDGEQTRDFLYVKDAVKAMYEGYKKDAVGIYNVGTGKETTINELVSTLSQLLEKEVSVECREGRKGEICRSVADITKLTGELGFKPQTDLMMGLKETLEWFKHNH
jgi:UDP-glucose 4-epimerase